MLPTSADRRQAKGVNFVDLVKILKRHRRKSPLPPMSSEAEALMDEHLLASAWYPFPILMELHSIFYEVILESNPDTALEMGVAGGRAALGGVHRVYVVPGDPMSTVLSMRHLWRGYFDFGELSAEAEGDHAVRFTVSGYPDCTEGHGMMIAGWHLAAALVSGAHDARAEVIEGPWKGAKNQVHRIML